MALPSNIGGDYSWARVFVEVALRAMRRLHLNYGWWDVGHHWLAKEARIKSINTGRGIELADERTVCAAISQEFLASPFTAGLWVESEGEGALKGRRYWKLLREVRYGDIDGIEERYKKTADFCLRRHCESSLQCPEYSQNTTRGIEFKPPYPEDPKSNNTFVEAKRVRIWTPDTRFPTKVAPKPNTRITKDIAKLRRILDQEGTDFYGHLLLWNVYECECDGPACVVKALNDNAIELHQIRWMPLEWDQPKVKDGDLGPPTAIDKWLWVALVEVGRAAT